MSLADANGGLSAADVAAVMGNNGNGFGFGGDGAWWFILLILLFANNGWGNGYGSNGGVGSEVQRGFDQSALVNGINGINSTLVANQNATTQGMNSLAMSLQNCCCENRAATADLKYTMASEAAATRANCDSNNQKILDKLCQLEMDGMRKRSSTLVELLTLPFGTDVARHFRSATSVISQFRYPQQMLFSGSRL